MDFDVIIVGAGPTGLILAGELRLAGVRPLVLERQPQPRDTPKANGLGGQILQLLRYRGVEAAGTIRTSDAADRPAANRWWTSRTAPTRWPSRASAPHTTVRP